MVRFFVSIALVCILSFGFLSNVGVLVWYQVELDYIEQELCENRFEEDSDCHGHCVLSKKMDTDRPASEVLPSVKLLVFTLAHHKCTEKFFPSVDLGNQTRPEIEPQDYHPDIFHPPKVETNPIV